MQMTEGVWCLGDKSMGGNRKAQACFDIERICVDLALFKFSVPDFLYACKLQHANKIRKHSVALLEGSCDYQSFPFQGSFHQVII